ncbi:hypothetical protein D3C81_813660 [compost metagenome]
MARETARARFAVGDLRARMGEFSSLCEWCQLLCRTSRRNPSRRRKIFWLDLHDVNQGNRAIAAERDWQNLSERLQAAFAIVQWEHAEHP